MTWSFPIGRLLGSELRIHVTFFLLIAWVGFSAYGSGGAFGAAFNILFVLALFACVVAHEFGHALMARRFGIRTPDITLLPIGGLARLERMPEKPGEEIAVALAGPAVNVGIAALLFLLGARIGAETLNSVQSLQADFWNRLALVNLILAVFNMIPAFPMDGGRVFRAVLCLWLDRPKATRVAALTGQALAIGLGIYGLTTSNPVLALIAVFIYFAAGAESQDTAIRAVSRKISARDAMITSYEALTPNDTLDSAAQAVIRTTQHEFPVIDPSGSLLGFVTRAGLFSALASDQPRSTSTLSVMETDIPRVALTTQLDVVLGALRAGAPAVAVCSSSGVMLGYITRENLGELMVIRGH